MGNEKRVPSMVYYDGYSRELAIASVGPGWGGLINEVFDTLATIKGTIKIIQVKEKWGGLRVYTDYVNSTLDPVIADVQKRSLSICEQCGAPGKLYGGGWIRTLCAPHAGDKPEIHDSWYAKS